MIRPFRDDPIDSDPASGVRHLGRDQRVARLERVRFGRRDVAERVEQERQRLAIKLELWEIQKKEIIGS